MISSMKLTKIFALVCLCNFLTGGLGLALNHSLPESSPEKHNKFKGIEIGKVLSRLGESLETPKPTNAILLLVEDTQDQQEFWNKLANSEPFKVDGFAHSCSHQHEDCFCDNVLKSKVISLLTWARMNNGMKTSTIFSSMPDGRNLSTLQIGQSIEATLFERSQELFHISLEAFHHGNTKQSNKIFKNSLESILQGLKQLEIKSKGKGYLLVVSANGHDSTNAVELIDQYASKEDTLIVIASTCSSSRPSYPYFVWGPGSNKFEHIQEITEIPSVIQYAIGCFNGNCSSNHNDLPISTGTYLLNELTKQDFQEIAKRVIRQDKEQSSKSPVDDIGVDMQEITANNETTVMKTGEPKDSIIEGDKLSVFKGSANQLIIGNTYIYGLAMSILIPIIMKY